MNEMSTWTESQPPPPPPERKKIPRPWLDQRVNALALKEQKPSVIWEDDDDNDTLPVIDLLAHPKAHGVLESLKQFWQGFCVPRQSTHHSHYQHYQRDQQKLQQKLQQQQQHRSTQSAPPVMAIWMEAGATATSTGNSPPYAMSGPQVAAPAAPAVIYIMHSPSSSPMTHGHKTTWQHQQYVPSPFATVTCTNGVPTPIASVMPSFDEMKPVTLGRTTSLPHRPPRVNRRSTSGKPPMPPPLRIRSVTADSRASSTSSRHRRSHVELDWTAESMEKIMTPGELPGDHDDDDSTIQSIEDDDDDDHNNGGGGCKQQWMMEWVAGSASSPRQHDDSENTFQSLVEPTYLPTCPTMLRDYHRCSILVSGWLAFSPGDCEWTQGISRTDIYYLVVLQSERTLHLQAAHGTHKSSGQSSQQEYSDSSCITRIELTRNSYVEMKLVSRFLGKALVVKSLATQKTLCTLLPVSLSPSFLKQGTMNLGPAAVAQHDAALHLMFALDSWIRSGRHGN